MMGTPHDAPGGPSEGLSQQDSLMADGSNFTSLPNLGTKNLNELKVFAPTIAAASNLEELFAEYKDYKKLRKKDEMDSNQEVGTPAFIVSQEWLAKYSEFILFDKFETLSKNDISIEPDHFERMHPGPISNYSQLCEADKDCMNLFGTGTLKNYPSEYIDAYIDCRRKTPTDFSVFNQELWQFLYQRYGGETIKRFYVRKSQIHTSVETLLFAVPVYFVNVS